VIAVLRRWLEYHTPADGVMFPAFALMIDEPIRDRVNILTSYKALYDMVRAGRWPQVCQFPLRILSVR